MEEIVEDRTDENIIAMIKESNIEPVKKLLDGDHVLTIDELSYSNQ